VFTSICRLDEKTRWRGSESTDCPSKVLVNEMDVEKSFTRTWCGCVLVCPSQAAIAGKVNVGDIRADPDVSEIEGKQASTLLDKLAIGGPDINKRP
jgi:hypothetical protein